MSYLIPPKGKERINERMYAEKFEDAMRRIKERHDLETADTTPQADIVALCEMLEWAVGEAVAWRNEYPVAQPSDAAFDLRVEQAKDLGVRMRLKYPRG